MKKHRSSLRSVETVYEKQLKEAQDLLDSSLDVICSLDIEGRFVNVSAASKFIGVIILKNSLAKNVWIWLWRKTTKKQRRQVMRS